MIDFISKEPITKGWSGDKKYCVTTADGTKYLLRISPIEQYARKKSKFEMMKRVAVLGVPMCQPIEFGTCDEGVYSLQSWINGQDAEDVISTLSDTEQYAYGLEAGRILKKIHFIPAPTMQEDWEIRFNRKIDRKIQMYNDCPIKYDNGRVFIDYINSIRHLLKNRPQCYQHGDYHIGNMMVDKDRKLKIIDFDFISKYGKVFKVFDDQDSGNICFGMKKNGERYFVKFAGAPTEQYDGDPADAIARLKATVPIYEALRHKNLIEYITSKEIGGGFAMIFKWVDGECMGRMYQASRRKFMTMPTETRLSVFSDVLSLFEYIASVGYVAIDFYDGSIMYDVDKKHTTICDIDFFHKIPCANDMGRMWGSSRFMSPEEFKLGATLDEITNVYTVGATAFALFADYSRDCEAWTLNDKLYDVALKAVSDNRNNRQQSIKQFIEEWDERII